MSLEFFILSPVDNDIISFEYLTLKKYKVVKGLTTSTQTAWNHI